MLTGTAVTLWDLLAEPCTADKLAAELAAIYAAEPSVVANDIEASLQEMVDSGIAEVVSEDGQ